MPIGIVADAPARWFSSVKKTSWNPCRKFSPLFCWSPKLFVNVSILEDVKLVAAVVVVVGDFCSILIIAWGCEVKEVVERRLFDVVTSDTWHGSRLICRSVADEVGVSLFTWWTAVFHASGNVRLHPVSALLLPVSPFCEWCWCKFKMQSLIFLLVCFELFDERLLVLVGVFEDVEHDEEALPELIFSDLIAAVVEKLAIVGVTGKWIWSGSTRDPAAVASHFPKLAVNESVFLAVTAEADVVQLIKSAAECDCTKKLLFAYIIIIIFNDIKLVACGVKNRKVFCLLTRHRRCLLNFYEHKNISMEGNFASIKKWNDDFFVRRQFGLECGMRWYAVFIGILNLFLKYYFERIFKILRWNWCPLYKNFLILILVEGVSQQYENVTILLCKKFTSSFNSWKNFPFNNKIKKIFKKNCKSHEICRKQMMMIYWVTLHECKMMRVRSRKWENWPPARIMMNLIDISIIFHHCRHSTIFVWRKNWQWSCIR